MFSISVPLLIGCLFFWPSRWLDTKKTGYSTHAENLTICKSALDPLIDGGNKCCAQTKGQKSVSCRSRRSLIGDRYFWRTRAAANEAAAAPVRPSCHLQLLLITAAAVPSVSANVTLSSSIRQFQVQPLLRHKLFKGKNGPISFWLHKLFLSFVTSTGYT